MADSIYYHVSRVKVQEGACLIKGRYGKRVKNREGFGSFVLHKEMVFEEIRKKLVPDAPSRFESVFLFKEYSSACAYRFKQHNYAAYIYEAEFQRGKIFEADHVWLDLTTEEVQKINDQPESNRPKAAESIFDIHARKYWQQNKVEESCSVDGRTIFYLTNSIS